MRGLQRLIALLVLVIFVPATVLAGPLRLCITQDGHRQIELFHSGGHDHTSSAHAVVDEASSPGSPSCTDLGILTAASISPTPSTSAKAVTSGDAGGEADVGLAQLSAAELQQVRATCVRQQSRTFVPDRRLDDLSTVVLLI